MHPDHRNFFDKEGVAYGAIYSTHTTHGYLMSHSRELVAGLLAREKGGALLDIGCGAGTFIPVARSAGFTYLGVDQSPSMVEGCRQLIGAANDARVVVGNAVSLPVEDSSFDAVLALGVFEYLDHSQRAEAFDQLVRAVKPGGLVIGSFSNYYSPYRTWYRWRGVARTPESLRFHEFKLADVRKLLEARGMSIVQTVPLGIHPFPPPIAERLPRLAANCTYYLRGRVGRAFGVMAMANLVVARRIERA